MAKLLGRLIKADFYQVLQSRQLAYADVGRLVGLIMDEYPLVVTSCESRFGDIAQLQSLRSKRGFVVAATQGLTSLDMVVGTQARQALLLNFNNLFLFSSHEAEVDAFAALHFGRKPATLRASVEWEDSREDADVATSPSKRRHKMKAEIEEWVCAPGALGRLDIGQAYVSLARGRRYVEPVWLEPLFFEAAIKPAATVAPRHDVLTKLFKESPLPLPEAEENEEAESPVAFLNEPGKKLSVEFTAEEYAELFINPDGLFSRYFQDKPDELAKLPVVPEKDENEMIFRVAIPLAVFNAVRSLPAKTQTDEAFVSFYGNHVKRAKSEPKDSPF